MRQLNVHEARPRNKIQQKGGVHTCLLQPSCGDAINLFSCDKNSPCFSTKSLFGWLKQNIWSKTLIHLFINFSPLLSSQDGMLDSSPNNGLGSGWTNLITIIASRSLWNSSSSSHGAFNYDHDLINGPGFTSTHMQGPEKLCDEKTISYQKQ